MSEDYEITRFLTPNYCEKKEKIDNYNTLKNYNNKVYSGMKIGGKHYWNYNQGKWVEVKKSPNKWKFTFNSIKTRNHLAPINTGANIQTKYHWYIIAEQFAEKIDANSYITTMKGEKFKLGHKRPYWRTYDYNYPEQKQLKDRLIEILEDILEKLKSK